MHNVVTKTLSNLFMFWLEGPLVVAQAQFARHPGRGPCRAFEFEAKQCDQTWPFPVTVAVFGVLVAGKIYWWPVAGVAGYYVVLNSQKKF